jgi:hypothetical protein
MSYRLIVPLVLAVLVARVDHALAESSFPAPLPGQATPISPLPRSNWAALSEACKGFVPLREDAEKKGKMIKAASERHALPEEACWIIGAYSVAEVKMMEFIETNAAECGIPGSVMEQLKAGHKNTEALQTKVCAIAEQIGKRGRPGQINDFGDPAFRPQPRGPVGDFPDTKGRY